MQAQVAGLDEKADNNARTELAIWKLNKIAQGDRGSDINLRSEFENDYETNWRSEKWGSHHSVQAITNLTKKSRQDIGSHSLRSRSL